MSPIPLETRYATESDAHNLARVSTAAFRHSPHTLNVFPEADESTLQSFMRTRIMQKLADPNVHVLAGVDTTTGEIVAHSSWTIPAQLGFEQVAVTLSLEADKEAKEALLERAPQPMNREMFEAIRDLLSEKKKEYFREDDMMLDLLCVRPDYQGKGVGFGLMQWGIKKADAVHAHIYLESSVEGYPLYSRCGFETLEKVGFDYTRFGGVGSRVFTLMRREPQSQKSWS